MEPWSGGIGGRQRLRSFAVLLGLLLLLWLACLQVHGRDTSDELIDADDDTKDQHPVNGDQNEGLDESDEGKRPPSKSSFGFFHAFVAAFSVIIVSEIGDKTFFIAAILAMKYSRCLVFGGALSALGFMTFLSVCLGVATVIIPRAVTFYICTALLAIFGVKMLYEGWKMSPNEGQEEFEEVSAELMKQEEAMADKQQQQQTDPEQGLVTKPPLRRRLKFLGPLVSPIFLQAFTLTFLAEWGDRSQLTTIVLAARENAVGVTLGGTIGHAVCTAMAVIGGNIIAQRISVKTVTLIGGVVFLLFAVSALFHDPND